MLRQSALLVRRARASGHLQATCAAAAVAGGAPLLAGVEAPLPTQQRARGVTTSAMTLLRASPAARASVAPSGAPHQASLSHQQLGQPLTSQFDSDSVGPTGLPLSGSPAQPPAAADAGSGNAALRPDDLAAARSGAAGGQRFQLDPDGVYLGASAAAPGGSAAAGPDGVASSSSGGGSGGSAVYSIAGESLPGRAAYLDLQATTPLDPRVLDAMLPFMVQRFGNPHSRTHAYGWDAEASVETARAQVAALIGADPKEIVFTSGATESNNMAVKGVARFYRDKKKHVITSTTEHKCVLDSCRALETEGWRVTYLPVQPNGLVDVAQLEAAMTPDTALVSIMGVNNEIGVIQPLAEIGALCRRKKVFFHTDAAQMVGKVPLNVDEANIDLMSISGHKVYGPKGIGALYVRRRPRVRMEPLISGGGQERGLRSGTLPHPLVVGLGAACEIARTDMAVDRRWVDYLSKRLMDGITARVPHVILNGDATARYPGNLNISFAYVEGESLLMSLKNLAVSSGSACTSASLEPSYVLRAIGVAEDLAHTSIRFGLGRFTTQAEVDLAVDLCARHVARLREMSPLWEMVQEGIDISSIQWTQEH